MGYIIGPDFSLPHENPFKVFDVWYQTVKSKDIDEVSAMTLSTVCGNRPKARTVLLKHYDYKLFRFYTNYNSHKGAEIKENPFASLTFYWRAAQLQVRIEGKLEKSDPETSDAYFNSRSKESQLASIISQQSSQIGSRRELLEKLESKRQQTIAQESLKRPDNWGGYDLIPDRFIFFIYGEHRINDRFEFKLKEGNWIINRLQP